MLVLQYKKINNHKWMCNFLHSSAKLITHYAVINKAFTPIHQSVMTKKKVCSQRLDY